MVGLLHAHAIAGASPETDHRRCSPLREIDQPGRRGQRHDEIEARDMTKTFERFLHSFSDEELTAFAQDRRSVQPPYWKVMRLALHIEAGRRGLRFDEDLAETIPSTTSEPEARAGTA